MQKTFAEDNKRLKGIKCLALDVDGVLTDGRTFYVEGTGWVRFYNIYDGHGIKLLHNAGIPVAFISGSDTLELRKRVELLKIQHAYLGSEHKLPAFEDLISKLGLQASEVAYVGDDVFDLPILERVGFAATVPHAIDEIKSKVHYVTQREGGQGAVREVIEMIRKAKGI